MYLVDFCLMRGMCDELEFSGVGDRVVYIVFGSIEEGVIN